MFIAPARVQAGTGVPATPKTNRMVKTDRVSENCLGRPGADRAGLRKRPGELAFGLKEGTNFMEYDLVYLRGDLLFWGARNIDGRGFDTEQNRPTNLQIPLVRK
jgi:hypothetical protein